MGQNRVLIEAYTALLLSKSLQVEDTYRTRVREGRDILGNDSFNLLALVPRPARFTDAIADPLHIVL